MSIASNATGEVPAMGAIHRVVAGDPTLIVTDTVELTVIRRLGGGLTGTVLTGAWPDQTTPLPLASAILR